MCPRLRSARPPLPAPLSIDSLFTGAPGDAVPIGLVDDPADDHEVLWWRPEHGHLVAIGPTTRGFDGLVATALAGIVDRYGHDEFDVVRVSEPDDATVVTVLDRLRSTDGAPLVLAVDDLGALRRRASALGDDALDAAVTSRRVTLVGRAATLESAGAVADDASTMLLVASPGDHGGRCRLAADDRVVQLAGPDRPASATGPEGSTS